MIGLSLAVITFAVAFVVAGLIYLADGVILVWSEKTRTRRALAGVMAVGGGLLVGIGVYAAVTGSPQVLLSATALMALCIAPQWYLGINQGPTVERALTRLRGPHRA